MKVISLLQPWASLVVMGAKIFETRSWKTKYQGNVLIHASQAFKPEHKKLCATEPFIKFIPKPDELPTGKIIGMVHIERCFHSEDLGSYMYEEILEDEKKWDEIYNQEKAFGDWSAGRYGWVLYEPVKFKNQYECKGSLSLWDCPEKLFRPIYDNEGFDCYGLIQ